MCRNMYMSSSSWDRWRCETGVTSILMSRQVTCRECRPRVRDRLALICRLREVRGSSLLSCEVNRTVENCTAAESFPGRVPLTPAEELVLWNTARSGLPSRLLR